MLLTEGQIFYLVYDFLKKNRILQQYVLENYKFHVILRNELKGIKIPCGRENVKKIILASIRRYFDNRIGCCDIWSMLSSFDASFEWTRTAQGHHFWSQYLGDGWKDYLIIKLGIDRFTTLTYKHKEK